MIRLAAPLIDAATEELVLDVLRGKRLAQGPMVERFEALCCDMAGTSHAVAVGNGTVALEAALRVSGIGPGDEVVTSPFTFIATLNAILSTGATARFADIADDFNLDPAAVEGAMTSTTKMLLPVHLYGGPADMTALSKIASRAKVALLEDAAQAHGASVGERRVGSFGLAAFSFYATKNVTSGEGGVITTSDTALAKELRLLRNQGMAERYKYERIGSNLRMSELHAAVAIPQLERLAEITATRTSNADALSQRLREANIDGLELPRAPGGRTHAWHQYTVLLPEGLDRDGVIDAMGRAEIEVGVYYPSLVWDHDPYRDNPQVVVTDTPRASRAARRCLSVPVHPGLSEKDVERVAHELINATRSR